MTQTKRNWWQEAVVYQIYPRSFMDSDGDGIGDLPGITSRLPYLAELGVDVVWISPIYPSPNADNGYDVSDYVGINPEFGTMADFDELLERAHELGLKIMLDMVFNHSSDEHEWFKASRDPEHPDHARYREFYHWSDTKTDWTGNFGDITWTWDEKRGQYYLHLFHEKQPDLNWEEAAVRDALYDVLHFWAGKGVDGFRFDVINYTAKTKPFPESGSGFADYCMNQPHLVGYLREMNERALTKYDLITVGEMPGVTTELVREYAGLEGDGLNMVFTFEHMFADLDLTGLRLDQPSYFSAFMDVLNRWQTELDGVAWNSLYWDNHDQARIASRLGRPGVDSDTTARVAALALHGMQGTPYIYQGEELGMTNYPFTERGQFKDVMSQGLWSLFVDNLKMITDEQALGVSNRFARDNARTPMQWSAEKHAGFSPHDTEATWMPVNPNYMVVNAAVEAEAPDSVYSFYRYLIELRHTYPAIVYGNWEPELDPAPETYSWLRRCEWGTLVVAVNYSDEARVFSLPAEVSSDKILIASEELGSGIYGTDGTDGTGERETRTVTLPPYSAAWWGLDLIQA